MNDATSGATATGYRVLARKYRPKTFADLIGQEAVVRTLTNAFASGRIAQAYMLTGVRGTGKTTTARLIARALNYGDQPTTDMPEATEHCQAILESRHVDVMEMDAASNTGVDNMREIIEAVRYKPAYARFKVYIIDEVHMLSRSAFNALLKTLEEPPPHVKFIFATTDVRKVPVTILSRCQRFDLRRVDAGLLAEHFAGICRLEGAEAESDALRMIARAAEGSVRDGLSLLDQAIVYGDGRVRTADVQAMLGLIDRARIIELFDAVMAGEAARAIAEFEAQHAAGGDPLVILVDLADFVHWVTVLKVAKEAASDAVRSESERVRGLDYASRLPMSQLTRAWQMLLKGLKEAEQHAQPKMAAEMLLIRLAHAAELPSGEDLMRLAREGAGTPAPQAAASAAPRSVSDPATAVSAQLAVAPQPLPPPEPAPLSFGHIRDVAALAAEHRDVKLKDEIERYVRPIRLGPGQIELALEPDAPAGFTNELARKLEAWTGRRWVIMLAPEGGDEPLAAQSRQARASKFREAESHADVQAILRRFPGAQIVDVRDLETASSTSDERTESAADEESR